MEDMLESRFKRVDIALANLADSTAKYNPNPVYANDLVTADAELCLGLEQLAAHQSNYSRILALRATSSALDNQIRETLDVLTSIRRDLISTPSTNLLPNANPVSYTTLLAYARRISKFTLPPSYRDHIPSNEAEEPDTKASKEAQKSNPINGSSTSKTGCNGIDTGTTLGNSNTALPIVEGEPTSRSTIATNNNNWSEYLNPHSNMSWTPWPSDETIRRGALASIQILLDQGINPATFDPEKSAELEMERKRIVEEEDRLRLEKERKQLLENPASAMPPAMTAATNIVPERRNTQPKVFQLETFDDEDDDDDDEDDD
ncbi:BgTH12-01427 [Blumeria graminis f. sp. triticale]|uniref:Mediator of RNA polymerase II transcription subunit 4 n=4 Tax=Blumeria graminis TaxID=34373 RepID=A0A656KN25_BLUGR|nr:hypothetical protein BGT96224_A20777 [Blumeria graminis f. sp. tritici 96224]CAD6501173.1 BgTH12-01427 [Blumeria graminis f. sp. triticale]VDB83576.1 BgtA-20777 [Blumeria graminis f. sp. tritici]